MGQLFWRKIFFAFLYKEQNKILRPVICILKYFLLEIYRTNIKLAKSKN